MTKIIIIEKENCKEDSIDDMNNLFKKCKFKKQEDFLELMTWNFKNYTLKLFGKIKGKSHTKFLYKFPDFEKNIYGNISIICFSNDQYYDLDLNLWNDFLNNFGKNNSELELENNKKNENFEETILENENEQEELEEDEDKEDEDKENLEEELYEKLENDNKEASDEEELDEEDTEELEEISKENNNKFDLEINDDMKYYSGSELAEDQYYYTSDEE
jgi:hypothetical protein